jgi:hypothetical protein
VAVAIGIVVSVGIALVGVTTLARRLRQVSPVGGPPRVVYTDDFHDPNSGWTTATLPSGTRFGYQSDAYVVNAVGDLHHLASSPYTRPVQQLTMTVSASQVVNGQTRAGFGVSCYRGSGTTTLHYEFLVEAGQRWFIERRDGVLSASGSPQVLAEGTSPAVPGSTPITVSGSCLTQSDGHTTHLAVAVNGRMVGQADDVAGTLSSDGWRADLDVASGGSEPCTATVTLFQERIGSLTGH